LDGGATFCSICGTRVSKDDQVFEQSQVGGPNPFQGQDARHTHVSPIDRGGFLWGFVGFLLTAFSWIITLILVLLWRDRFPKRSRAMLIGMAVGFVLNIVFAILMFTVWLPRITEWAERILGETTELATQTVFLLSSFF